MDMPPVVAEGGAECDAIVTLSVADTTSVMLLSWERSNVETSLHFLCSQPAFPKLGIIML